MRMQKMNVYFFINHKGVKELIYCIASVKHTNNVLTTYNHGQLAIPVTSEPNKIFQDSMKINYSVNKPTMLESQQTGTLYHIFKSEFKWMLENTTINKGIVDTTDWTIRSHGGLFSIKLAI